MAICLQHVNDVIPSIANYSLASNSVPSIDTLGTAIYIHNSVTYDKIQINTSEFQVSGVKLHINNCKINLYNVYNQPSCNYDMKNLPNSIPNIQEDFLLVGDFNAHNPLWSSNCTDSDTNGTVLEQVMINNNLCILNDGDVTTYYSKAHGTYSSIDLSICSGNIVDKFEWNVLDDLYSSDHFPVLITTLGHTPNPPIQRFNTNKADWDSYKFHTSQIPPYDNTIDHNETAEYLTNFVKNAAEKAMPLTSATATPLKHCVPWWSNTLFHLIKEKHVVGRKLETLNKRFNNLSNKPQKTNDIIRKLIDLAIEISVLKPYFNRISAKFRRETIKGKIISWQKYITNISETTSMKKVWQKFRSVNGTHSRMQRHALMYNGTIVHDMYEISNILGRNIQKISSIDNLDDHFKAIKIREENIPLNFETLDDLYYNSKFTEQEFEFALSTCGSTAPGKDNVNFEMISHLAPAAKVYLLQFYNHLWVKHLFPKEWKHAIVIPIEKPGKDPSNPNNYRPISLTSCLCKLLEKMVNYRLNWCLRKNKVLSSSQFGSQKERSTLDNLAHLEDHVRRGFERKQITIAILFDIQKAYDTTWRHSIMKSLHINGFRGHLPIFIKNFIEERTFQTRIENVYSNNFNLECGVPQGSVLSGTLFAMAINDIVTVLPQGVQNSLYVDDFAIYYSSNSLRHLQRILNTAIKKIHNWTASVGFRLSVEKTQAIMFYKDSRWKHNENIELKIENSHIQFKDTIKFLGLVFDTHLNWKAHVAYIKNRCNSALNLIMKLAHTTWGARRSTLLMLYKALVVSRIDYGSPIYGSASKATLKNLDPIHTRGLRLCSGAFRSSPNISVLCDSGEPPLSLHRDLVTMRSALKILSSDSPTKKLFEKRDIFINNHEPPFPIRANRLIESTNIRVNLSQPFNYPPPWTLRKIEICLHLTNLSKKSNFTPSRYKQYALEHINKKGPHYAIYTDGSKSLDGVGCAAVSQDKISKFSLPKEASIFTAELTAIELALDIIKKQKNKNIRFVIYSDSRSALEALQGYTNKNTLISQVKKQLSKLYSNGSIIELCWIPSHVGIGGNEMADAAAKSALKSPNLNIKLPAKDLITEIKYIINKKWQNQWNGEPISNKLKQIKDSVSLWESSNQNNRRVEVILTRLRIGHTRLTHGWLMSTPHEDIPECTNCNCILTVKHIFCECNRFNRERILCFGRRPLTLTEIFAESKTFTVSRILMFLRQIKLIDKI